MSRQRANDQSEIVATLKHQFRELERQKIEAGRDLKHAKDRLQTLASEAREKYGTDDLDELRERLAAMRAENKKRLEDYRRHLESLEKGLGDIESRYAAAEADDAR